VIWFLVGGGIVALALAVAFAITAVLATARKEPS
jgi:hypothetical protein